MQQRHYRIHDVIIKTYPEGTVETVKSHNIISALQGLTDEQYLYMHTVDGNTLEIGVFEQDNDDHGVRGY